MDAMPLADENERDLLTHQGSAIGAEGDAVFEI